MKRIIYISLALCLALLFSNESFGQGTDSSLRDRLARRQADQNKDQGVSLPRLTARAEMKNQGQSIDLANASWVREIYRILDAEKSTNAALSNPRSPINGRMSLFTMIFKLMGQGDLTAYEYLMDGVEIFTDQYKVDFAETLNVLEVPFERDGNQFHFNEMDIPSNEIFGFYIKEAWYFDKTNSVLGTEVLAICPVLDRAVVSDYGDMNYELMPTSRVPLFWVPYENLRPYAARMPIMTSNYNNAITKTIDDYFALRLYTGEIYKTTNMENKILIQQYKTEEELKAARSRIETELKMFGDSLWVFNDSIPLNTKVKNKKQTKHKQAKSTKQSSSNTKSSNAKLSVRDRR